MSFKNTVFTDAATHINTMFPAQKGAQKCQSSCKSKWNNLKKSYNVVMNIKTLSGFSWSDEQGISLTPETSGAWESHLRAHPQSKPYASKGFPLFNDVEELMPTAAKGKFVKRQPYARKQASGSSSSVSMMPPPAHTGSMMPPPATPPARTSALHSSPSTPNNSMNLMQLTAAANAIRTSPAAPTSAPTSSYVSSSELTSISRGKCKHDAAPSDGGQRSKCSCPPLVAVQAQQEGSAALTSIAQFLPHMVNSLAAPPASFQPECPPATSLGCAIASLGETEGLGLDDVLLLSDYLSVNPPEAVICAAFTVPLWRAAWAQKKLATLRGNGQ